MNQSVNRKLASITLAAGLIGSTAPLCWAQPAQPTPKSPPPTKTPASSPEPPLVQTSPPLDLGYHKPKSLPSGLITLMNNGEKPLKITQTKGDCACTDVTPDRSDLAPGESTNINVGVDVPREIGPIRRNIQVFCEGYELPFVTLVSLEAGYAVRVNGGGGRAVIADKVGLIKLDSVDRRPFHVLSINGQPPEFIGDSSARSGAPGTDYTVRYDWARLHGEAIPRWMVIETDHPEASMFALRAMVDGYQPLTVKTKWFVLEERLLLGSVPGDAPLSASVTLSGKPFVAGATITTTSSNPAVSVNITGLRKPTVGGGMIADLEVKPQVGFRGFLSSVIRFQMNDDTAAFDLFGEVGEPGQPRVPAAD